MLAAMGYFVELIMDGIKSASEGARKALSEESNSQITKVLGHFKILKIFGSPPPIMATSVLTPLLIAEQRMTGKKPSMFKFNISQLVFKVEQKSSLQA